MDEICADFGMATSTAFTIFARTVGRERKIPFEVKASNDPYSKERALETMREMRASAIRNGAADTEPRSSLELRGFISFEPEVLPLAFFGKKRLARPRQSILLSFQKMSDGVPLKVPI